MNHKQIATAILVMVALMAMSATAEIVTTAVYNPVTQQIEYELTGGQNGEAYEIKAVTSGCVDTLNDPPDLVGPAGADVVGVVCNGGPGVGTIVIEFCDTLVCFSAISIRLNCSETCDISVSRAVPGLTTYALAALATLLLLSGIILRRRRERATA